MDFMFPGDKTELHSLLLKATDHGIFTLGPTTIARIDRDRLIAEMFDHPHVTVALWWNALQREAILRERITAIGRRDAYARVAHLLCEMFERLSIGGRNGRPLLQLPVTQAELGDALGISEVYANRMLRRLQNEKLIVAEHRTLRIPDLEALKRAAAVRRALPPSGRRAEVGARCPRRTAPNIRRCVIMPQERVAQAAPGTGGRRSSPQKSSTLAGTTVEITARQPPTAATPPSTRTGDTPGCTMRIRQL